MIYRACLTTWLPLPLGLSGAGGGGGGGEGETSDLKYLKSDSNIAICKNSLAKFAKIFSTLFNLMSNIMILGQCNLASLKGGKP